MKEKKLATPPKPVKSAEPVELVKPAEAPKVPGAVPHSLPSEGVLAQERMLLGDLA